MEPTDRDDFADRAQAVYDERYRAEFERTHMHAFVAIEPESGDAFLGQSMSEAGEQARAAHPGRKVFFIRVGHEVAIHIGGGLA